MTEKRTFNGDSPINARIKIDYSEKKPKVTFSYPEKKHQVKGTMFIPIFSIWIILACVLGIFVLDEASQFKPVYQDNSLYNFTKCISDNSNISKTFDTNYNKLDEKTCESPEVNMIYGLDIIVFGAILSGITILLIEGFVFLTLWLFKKPLNRLYPKWAAFGESKKYAVFSSGDVQYDSKLGYYCEIPSFANVVLDYKASKDFSKQLYLFEIKEHNFYTRAYKRFYRGVKKNSRRNEFIWYARFYFKNKPSNGRLEVIFR